MRTRGFTLLEVMVAVAILGLGLTAILSAQFSAVSATAHAKNLSLSTGLARCKMSEIEDQLRVEGFPEVELAGQGPCCEGDASPNISCSWRVERPTFPDANYGELDLDSDLDTSAIGKLTGGESAPTDASSIGALASSLGGGQGGIGDLASGGIGGIASMVMSMVYPDLKMVFEASTRRITVVLTWTEGDRRYDVEIVQWVTQPQAGLAAANVDLFSGEAGGTPPAGGQPPGGLPGSKGPAMGKTPALPGGGGR
jgi:general secretion pathway protein I